MSLSNTLYTAQAGQVKQESMEDRLAGLEKEKQLKYLLWKIGDLTEREGLGLGEYWPHMKAWEDLEEPVRDRVLKALGEETRALELLEEAQPGHARWALTMRDKLLLYIEAIHRMMEYPDEELDRPCLWRDFRAKVAMEVKKGRRAE
ncbi:hypothetical protein JQM64_05980 [Fournierella massiliensis]|nr:hypothetical protein [Fournierella massiliensis]MCF2557067.1 hypothetical protein [Fournierella massiliensis]